MVPAFRATMLLLLAMTAAAQADALTRRGDEPTLEGAVERVDESGVAIRSSLGAVHVVTWDRVRHVDAPRFQQEINRLAPMAADLWRARSRVERGDTGLAEPLLERWFGQMLGKTHETALVTAEGLLRCRLARGDHVQAVLPALETARLRRAGPQWSCYGQLDPVIESTTSLCPVLAPQWPVSPLLQRLHAQLAGYNAQGDEVIAAMALLYRRAALQLDPDAAPSDVAWPRVRHPGVDLLMMIVRAGSPTDDDRREAMNHLESRLGSMPFWAEGWGRYQLGLGWLRDADDVDRRQLGLLHLLHVPARFGRSQPRLAAAALERAAQVLEQDGRAEAAGRLREDLAEYHGPRPAVHRPPPVAGAAIPAPVPHRPPAPAGPTDSQENP